MKGSLIVGVTGLDHGHIYGMCGGLEAAGATIGYVHDRDPGKVKAFRERFPSSIAVPSFEDLLDERDIGLIATAGVPSMRCGVILEALSSGKHGFSDKPPMTNMGQVAMARAKVGETGLRWFTYYSERIHSEAAIYAGDLIRQGRIGKVVSVKSWGPHRIGDPSSRPSWFWDKERYGGILTDIGSHQIEQCLYYASSNDAALVSSRTGNLHHPDRPGFEDYGDALLITDNGVPCYISVDWFTPDGLSTWGDGRVVITGTEGYIELRKYTDVARDRSPDHVILVDSRGEYHYPVHGKVGFPFFQALIADCLEGTDTAMGQEHIFRSIELAIEAEEKAVHIR